MVTICPTLENFQSVDTLFPIIKNFPKDCVLENGVFFSEQAPCCPVCGGQMVHNGYNIHTKKGSVNSNLENIIVRIVIRIPKNPPLFSENY
jgi:hypothetical protein